MVLTPAPADVEVMASFQGVSLASSIASRRVHPSRAAAVVGVSVLCGECAPRGLATPEGYRHHR